MSDALNNLDSSLSGDQGGATAYTNQVYLGKQESPAAKGVIRGKKIDTGKAYSDKTLTTQQAKSLYLTDENLRSSWLQTLKRNGLPTDPIKARAVWDIAVDGASDWYATSNGKQKITPEQYLTWYAGGKKKGPSIPSRSIYQYTPEQLDAKADEIVQNVAGRAIVDADRNASWYKNLMSSLNELVMQGTVSTVQQVRNPKTGKMEKVTIQKPEVTTEAITQKITSAIKEADPVSVQRKQDLDVEKWFLSMRGNR